MTSPVSIRKIVLFCCLLYALPAGADPLHDAISKDDHAKVERLLEGGENVNTRDEYGDTPLHWAAAAGRPQMVELLLKHGADINARGENGRTALISVVTEIGGFADEDREERYSSTAILLINKGADVTVIDTLGKTALHQAAYYGMLDVAKELIKKGADVNANGGAGTPLHEATEYLDMVELLVGHGADVNAKSSTGLTPLHRAARGSSAKIVEFLISKGADVNAKTNDGRTPLNIAVASGNHEVASKLYRQRCTTARDVDAMNGRAAKRIFHLEGVDAKIFLALDPYLVDDKVFLDRIMEQDIDEIIVWRLTAMPMLAAAVPFANGCAIYEYGEPDQLDKITAMRDVVELIRGRGVEDHVVKARIASLMVQGMPQVSPEVFKARVETRVNTTLKRVRGLLTQ